MQFGRDGGGRERTKTVGVRACLCDKLLFKVLAEESVGLSTGFICLSLQGGRGGVPSTC